MSMKLHAVLRLFTLMCYMLILNNAYAVTVTHLSEGKINSNTSLVMTLEGDISHALQLPVIKDDEPLQVQWILSDDKTFQYFPINKFGIGVYKVSLVGIDRGKLEQVESIEIYEASPSVRVLGQGPFLNATATRAIPVETINATGVSASIYKVDNMPALFNEYFYSKKLSSWSAQRLRKSFTHQEDLNFKLLNLEANESIISNLELPTELKNGWYIIAIKPSNSFESPEIFHVLLSDIGLQAKVFKESVAIQAIDLESNLPLSSGTVYVIGKNGERMRADLTDGYVQFDYRNRSSEDVFVVESGNSFAVLPIKEVPLDLSDFAVDGLQEQELSAFLFSNRDLFKPSEAVPLNIVLRETDGYSAKTNSLFVELIKPDGKIAVSKIINEVVDGVFSVNFDIPPSAPLGKWTVIVHSNRTSKDSLGQLAFNVAEFVPERMDLDLQLPNVISVGEKIEGIANGRYLFGQVADGNKLRVSGTYRSNEQFQGKFQDYFIGKKHTIPSYHNPNPLNLVLNDEGIANFEVETLAKTLLDGPATLTLTSQLFESGGATTTRVNRIVVSNRKSIVGIKPAKDRFGYFENAEFSLLLIDAKGKESLSGKAMIKVERNRGGYYWVYTQSSGWDLKRDDKWRIVESKAMELNAKQNIFSLPVEWGQYRLTALSADGQETVYQFYVGWRDGEEQIPVKPDQLSMKLDKESYLAGESIDVQLNAPMKGLVSLELVDDKSRSIQTFMLDGKGSAKVKLPDLLYRHDLYLIATLVNSEKPYVRRLLSVAPVKLYRDDSRINVSIEAPTKLIPFTKQRIMVSSDSMREHGNGWVILSIADKGITNLSRYSVPNLFDWFYGHKRLSADILDLYSKQFEARPSSFIKHRYGGDSALASNKPLGDLVESKTFNEVYAPAKFDNQGRAFIDVQVPDYNGEVQIVAMVFNGSRFGQKISDVKVSAPIVAELSVPRFFASGDSSQVLVEASNQTEQTQKVTLTLNSTGPLALQSVSSKVFEIAPNEKIKFPVRVVAGQQIGMANFKLMVDSNVYNVERSWQVPVRATSPYVNKQSTRILNPSDSVLINDAHWQGIKSGSNNMSSISFSRIPEIETGALVQGLFTYPYGCVEQTTSTAYPWLLNDDSLLPLKQIALKGKQDVDLLQRAISKLTDSQNSVGGFGLWSANSPEEVWLTSYVANFLFQVQEQYPDLVNKSMLDKTVKRLKQNIYDKKDVDDIAYAAYVLALNGQLSFSDARSHLKGLETDNALSSVYFGAVFHMLGDLSTSSRYFTMAIKQNRSGKIEPRRYYDSEISSLAKIVTVMSNVESLGSISTELQDFRIRAAEAIFSKINTRNYFSTQEKYALVDAGFKLKKLNSGVVSVTHNDLPSIISSPVNMVEGDRFVNSSSQVLYVTESISGYADPSSLSSSVDVNEVNRNYYDTQGNRLTNVNLRVGDSVVVELTIKLNENLSSAMLIDYLPAGMVIENPNFTASQGLLDSLQFKSSGTEMQEFRNDRYVTSRMFSKNTDYKFYYVMRAETIGVSTVPSIYIEDMYAPERYIFEAGKITSITISD